MNGRRRRVRAAAALVALALLGAARALPADVSLRWHDGRTASASMLADYLVESNIVSDFVELVDANFAFERPLVIAIGAATGPGYDPAKHTIRLPHAYLEEAVRAQASLLDAEGTDGEEALAVRRALDLVEYTLYHLLGHALAGSDDVALDETAEALSSWAMLAYWPGGAEQWERAVTAFADASQRLDGALSDYWHEHALYAARERHLRCLIAGRDPTLEPPRSPGSNAGAAGAATDKAARRRECRRAWVRLDAEARLTLDPLLLEDAPLRHGRWREGDRAAGDDAEGGVRGK